MSGKMLPDEAIDNATKFGFADYSTLLSDVIRSDNLKTPFTIAIHGDWGSGKTTLMKCVWKKLEQNTDFKVKQIWFSAWEFEKLNIPLWNVFLNRIVIDLQDMLPEGKLKNKLKVASKEILSLAGDQLLQKYVGIGFKDLEKVRDALWRNIEIIASLREQLSNYINQALSNDPEHRKRVIIYIDDLDRCLPNQCIEIFESMKLFLNCNSCVFVLGVDKNQMTAVFQTAFEIDDKKRGLDYFEKFIQLEFELPRKTSEEVKEFLLELAPTGVKGNSKTVELISRFIDPNPRRIKRWLNSVSLLERLFKIQQERTGVKVADIDLDLASIWMFIRSFFVEFAGRVEADPTLLNASIRVARGESSNDDQKKTGEFSDDKKLIEFLSSLNPSYSTNQLKDLIYLTQLTPILSVSSDTKDVISQIPKMSQSQFSALFNSLSEEDTLPLADRLVDELILISDWETYEKKVKFFDFFEVLLGNVGKSTIKIKIFNKIFDFILQSDYAYKYFVNKLGSLISTFSHEELTKNGEVLSKLISVFAISKSFEDAKIISALLLNFKSDLTNEQIETIKLVSTNNNQIKNSYGAQNNLAKLYKPLSVSNISKKKVRKNTGKDA